MTMLSFISIAIPTVGIIVIVKYVEIQIPKLLKRKRKEWELEKIKEDYKNNVKNIETQRAINTEKLETAKKLEAMKKEENNNNNVDLYPLYKKKKQGLTYKEKVEKGKKYEAHVANYFKEQGYYVWEHGKEKGRKDKSIDLFVRKDDHAYFVQCKNWEKWKISDKVVKATRMDIREYLKENKEFWKLIKEKNVKILYATSKECLTQGAYRYIQENKDIIEYKVIPMDNSQRGN